MSVFAGCANDNSFLGVFLSEVASHQLRHEEKRLLEKDKDRLLQQKEIVISLSSDESNTNEDESVMLLVMEHDTNKYKVLQEDEREVLLLENLLEKYESNYEWKPQVDKLCFNNFDEEVMFLEVCIDKDESVKDLVRLDG